MDYSCRTAVGLGALAAAGRASPISSRAIWVSSVSALSYSLNDLARSSATSGRPICPASARDVPYAEIS